MPLCQHGNPECLKCTADSFYSTLARLSQRLVLKKDEQIKHTVLQKLKISHNQIHLDCLRNFSVDSVRPTQLREILQQTEDSVQIYIHQRDRILTQLGQSMCGQIQSAHKKRAQNSRKCMRNISRLVHKLKILSKKSPVLQVSLPQNIDSTKAIIEGDCIQILYVDNQLLCAGLMDYSACIIDLGSFISYNLIGHTNYINSVCRYDFYIATSSTDLTVKLWKKTNCVRTFQHKKIPLKILTLGVYIISIEKHAFSLWNVTKPLCKQFQGTTLFQQILTTFVALRSQRKLIIGTYQGKLIQFELKLTAVSTKVKQIAAHSGSINCLMHNQSMLISSGFDKKVKIWNEHLLLLKQISIQKTAVSLSLSKEMLLIGQKGQLELHDLVRGDCRILSLQSLENSLLAQNRIFLNFSDKIILL